MVAKGIEWNDNYADIFPKNNQAMVPNRNDLAQIWGDVMPYQRNQTLTGMNMDGGAG